MEYLNVFGDVLELQVALIKPGPGNFNLLNY